ncbi:MAG: hypothetical protein WC405_07160 [Syntrophales bacterium]
MNIIKRMEKIEGALTAGCIIPKAERFHVIKGRSIQGQFIPDDPEKSAEKREAELIRKYGNADGVLFVNLIDKWS